MKPYIIVASILACSVSPLFGQAESRPDLPTTPSTQLELDRLQEEFNHRKAEALRPVMIWYGEQLEVLLKKKAAEAADSERKIAEVFRGAKEAFWQEDQPELNQALVRNAWSWRSSYDPHGVRVIFRRDNTVEHIGMRGTWQISGPSEVTIATSDGDRYVLRFNSSQTAYQADHHNVSGDRMSGPR